MHLARSAALAATLIVAACVAPGEPPPPPPIVTPAPPPVVALPPPPPEDWRDVALTPGTWTYSPGKDGSIADFGSNPAAPVFVMQCEVATRAVTLRRPGVAPAGQARLTTSYGTARYPTGAILDGVGWRLAARDPALDRIAFSRGRFMVEGLGARLVLPAWAEVARVIEDCRG